MHQNIRIYYHESCLDHDTGPGHPECPARLQSIYRSLKESARLQHAMLPAPAGTDDQVLLAHTTGHLQRVRETIPASGRASIDADTIVSSASFEAAMRSVGAACQGVDDLMTPGSESAHVMVMTRPPGHHATRSRAMGFCLFNHVAIAALHARRRHGLQRIAVVDFDVHHGNGTQDILQGVEGMHYLSTHQAPHYPGTGSRSENRAGNISNFPIHAGMNDEDFQALFSEEVLPLLEADRPELLLVSAGFDAHLKDPLAGIGLTEETYFWLGEQLGLMARRFSHGMLSVLEGGYNLAVLGSSVEAYLAGSQPG